MLKFSAYLPSGVLKQLCVVYKLGSAPDKLFEISKEILIPFCAITKEKIDIMIATAVNISFLSQSNFHKTRQTKATNDNINNIAYLYISSIEYKTIKVDIAQKIIKRKIIANLSFYHHFLKEIP